MIKDRIARLSVTLDGAQPAVHRCIEVPLSLTPWDLHVVIQAAMGWDNDHLYGFRVGKASWGDADQIEGGLDVAEPQLGDLIGTGRKKKLRYLYDFGDSWEHTIKVERVFDAAPGMRYPRLVDASGRCPPEDIGGLWGYAEFLEAIGDPKHERHEEFMEWFDGRFDPNVVDTEGLAAAVDRLARAWSPKAPARRKLPKRAD